jgi:hypothetical protein
MDNIGAPIMDLLGLQPDPQGLRGPSEDFLEHVDMALLLSQADESETEQLLKIAVEMTKHIIAPRPFFSGFITSVRKGYYRERFDGRVDEVWDPPGYDFTSMNGDNAQKRIRHALVPLRWNPPDEDMARGMVLNRHEYKEARKLAGLPFD